MLSLGETKYILLENFLDKENCAQLTEELKKSVAGKGVVDPQCPKSLSIRNTPTFDKLLVDLLPHFENYSGKKLLPTYSYARLYAPGEILEMHRDRPACEISATLTLGFEGNPWPIWAALPGDSLNGQVKKVPNEGDVYIKNAQAFAMNVGDALLYHGCDVYHWRNEYTEGKWQAQVFLHYVDAEGPYKDQIYDRRGGLTIDPLGLDNDLTLWTYEDILSPADCDMLVKLYSKASGESAGIGATGHVVDNSIRNVNCVRLPNYKGIGARLAAAGLDANRQRWKFDITHCNQAEFLRYPAGGGKYKGHVDTFLDMRKGVDCRKLTVLAFLNDDYTGGKFYIQTSHERFYPPQKKGTVIVFPSFLLHGVEDVEEGERYSAVAWMVGPWFR